MEVREQRHSVWITLQRGLRGRIEERASREKWALRGKGSAETSAEGERRETDLVTPGIHTVLNINRNHYVVFTMMLS